MYVNYLLLTLASLFYGFGVYSAQPGNKNAAFSEIQRTRAMSVLQGILQDDSARWEKVHAASYLLQLDEQEGIQEVFLSELREYGDSIAYRTGIWRTLVRLPVADSVRNQWLERLNEIATDMHAPDRLHAVESLAKLGYPVENQLAPISASDSILAVMLKWSDAYHSEAAKQDALQHFLTLLGRQTASEREKRLAAYAIRHLSGVSVAQWGELAAHALSDSLPQGAAAYILSAALSTAPADSMYTQRVLTIKEKLLGVVSISGKTGDRVEVMLALGERGDVADVPFLEQQLDHEPAVRAAAAYALLRIDRRFQPSLTTLDWTIIVLYGLGMLWVGWHYSRQNKTREDYLLGGRKMNPIAVGISLFATLLSTLSYLSYPGEMIKYGPAIFAGMFAFPLVYYAAGWWLIPRIMQMNVTSAYEILEYKLGLSVRMMATFMFLSLRFLWMATIIYVTIDVALFAVVPFDRAYMPLIGILLMGITIIYTALGGLKAVVVTDVVQSVIFLGGALLSVVVVIVSLGSFTGWLPTEWPAHWAAPQIGFDMQERSTIGNAMLMLFVWYICTTGSDQMAIQRYLSTKDIAAARKSLRVSLYTNLLAKILLGLVGLAMLAYFGANKHLLADGKTLNEQADTLFPRFILVGLPTGLSGLVIAGLLAAAMSSLSSGLNSVSSVLSQDIFKRFAKKRGSLSSELRNTKRLAYFTGAVTMLLSTVIAQVEGNLFDVVVKVVNLFVAPLFVLFFIALFVRFATVRGTLIAGIASVIVAIAIAYYQIFGITVLWILPVSLAAGIFVGVIISFIESKLFKQNQ